MACDPISELLGTGSVCMAPYVTWLFAANDAGFPGTGQALLAAETYGTFGSVWPSLTVPLCQFCFGPISGPEGPAIPVDPGMVARLLDPLATSRSISAGILPGLAPVQTMEQLRLEMLPAAMPTEPLFKNTGATYFFVLRNGTTDLVKLYWLGQDWLLHYVTVTGERKAIPLLQLNVNATASANYERGVTFSLPGWPASPSRRR